MGVGRRMSARMGELRDRQRRRSDARVADRVSTQFAAQWAALRAERQAQPRIEPGPTNFSRAQVPWGVDLAAAWAWRFLVIAAAGTVIAWVLARFAVVTVPLVIALLVTALATPLVDLSGRVRVPRQLAAAGVVLGGLGVVVLLLTFVGTQISAGISDLADQVVTGLEEIRDWLRTGPLQASDSQINAYIQAAQDAITNVSNEQILTQVTEVGTTLGHIVAGIFIVLFASYFMLSDGERIWAWAVRLFPRAARLQVDQSGRVAWRSVTQFVRATVLVALVDAIGIMLVALLLDLPLVTAIGVLVFLGAFIPIVGATLSGSVAVLVALVAQGPIAALLMLAGVIAVQQIEAHVLQPFLMGRFVAVHPLGVIVAIAAGVLLAGIAGALIAVPLVAALNAVAQHLARATEVGEDPEEAAEEDDSLPR